MDPNTDEDDSVSRETVLKRDRQSKIFTSLVKKSMDKEMKRASMEKPSKRHRFGKEGNTETGL